MTLPDDDSLDREPLRAALGLLILGLTCVFSNYASVPLEPGLAMEGRLASRLVRGLFVLGFGAQMVTGLWLALSLIFDVRRGTRAAVYAWLGALGLFFAPVPAIRDDPVFLPAVAGGAVLLALLTRALDAATSTAASG